MRILGGKYKGKSIEAGNSLFIRPLTNKLKESIFNTLDDFFYGKDVLDLFAGSGSFGIEACSRGAASVTFVDSSARSLNLLEKNLEQIGIPTDCIQICRKEVIRYCSSETHSFDLIFTDPPFNFNPLQNLIDLIMKTTLLQQNGILVLHHEISNPIESQSSFYKLFKQRRFGRNITSYIIHEVKDV